MSLLRPLADHVLVRRREVEESYHSMIKFFLLAILALLI